MERFEAQGVFQIPEGCFPVPSQVVQIFEIIYVKIKARQIGNEILQPANLNNAYKKVKSNKGAGGVDGMSGLLVSIIM